MTRAPARTRPGLPEPSRAALIDARLSARQDWRGWLVALAALVAAGAALWVFQTQVERWVVRATFRVVRDGEPKRVDDRLVGRWTSPDGNRVLIGRSGVIWSEAGDLLGTGTFDPAEPSRFVFEGPGFRCTYRLLVSRDSSEWQLRDHSPATSCPEGHFVRTFAF